MAQEAIPLMDLPRDEVPADLRPETYFDFHAHPFEHRALFDEASSVCQAIRRIGDYAKRWLAEALETSRSTGKEKTLTADDLPPQCLVRGSVLAILGEGALFAPRSVLGPEGDQPGVAILGPGAQLVGCDLDLRKGHLFVGCHTTIEAGVGVKGPTIIGRECEIRQGAYLRGDCILGDGCTIRGEIKNSVLMDKANFPHPSYLGDSLCGYMTHFGNQATAANLGLYEGLVDSSKRRNLKVTVEGKVYDTGSPKMGVCMGDFSQVGCNSTTDPGTFLRPYTLAYTLTRITKGFYGPNEVLKNKPMEHGIVERAPLRPL